MKNSRGGQTLSEFVVVFAALTLIGLILGYRMISPSGAVPTVQMNASFKIANDGQN